MTNMNVIELANITGKSSNHIECSHLMGLNDTIVIVALSFAAHHVICILTDPRRPKFPDAAIPIKYL